MTPRKEPSSLWEFLREMPLWYRIWVGVLFAWLAFVACEDIFDHIVGHPFWPVTNG